jgi:urea transporter
MVLTWRPAWFGHAVFGVLLCASLLAAISVMSSSVDLSLLPSNPDEVVSGQAFSADTRALTPPFNIAGAASLILGAVISALHFWRTRALPHRVASNVLIAVGAFVPSLSSGLTRFGITSIFFIGELVGLVCILAGFLLSGSTEAASRERAE